MADPGLVLNIACNETNRPANAATGARAHAAHGTAAPKGDRPSSVNPATIRPDYSAATCAGAFRKSRIDSAASRPSRIAQTTSDAPRTMSPTA